MSSTATIHQENSVAWKLKNKPNPSPFSFSYWLCSKMFTFKSLINTSRKKIIWNFSMWFVEGLQILLHKSRGDRHEIIHQKLDNNKVQM